MKYYKRVLLPITVTDGDLCWGNGRCCEHFDNTGGHPNCQLNLDWQGSGCGLKYNKDGDVNKPTYCKDLKEV